MNKLKSEIFSITDSKQFNNLCLELFNFQYSRNAVYKQYVNELGIKKEHIKSYEQIPFLPIDFFKSHQVVCSNDTPEIVFQSSGTTGIAHSKHFVSDISIYEESFLITFKLFFGSPENYTFLALLPSYSERNDSSLVYMVQKLMNISLSKSNGFYMNNYKELFEKIIELENLNKKAILFGVTFALTDFFSEYQANLKHTFIIETGGMKGRKKEMTREELHVFLRAATGLENIYSEYGMTELLSQAYSKGNDKFICPPWMKILIRDVNDPFAFLPIGKTGGINIIDLANINSCAFIETKDLGKLYDDRSFEVKGRFDNSDLRGCNLMVM